MSPEEKFKNISIEADTKIHAIKYLNLDGTDCWLAIQLRQNLENSRQNQARNTPT